MKKSLAFYLAGGLLGVMLFGYIIYLINFTASKLSVVSGSNLLHVPEIATYNFAKFKQVKGAPQ